MRNTTAPSPHPLRKSLRTLQMLLTLLATLAAVPAQAQRMPQDSWYLAKEMEAPIFQSMFKTPGRSAFGPDGNLYVIDDSNNNIQIFDTEGKFIKVFTSDFKANSASGIAINQSGIVYVCLLYSEGGFYVKSYGSDGNLINSFGAPGSLDGQLNYPRGIAIDNGGNVYIGDSSNYRINSYKADGTFIKSWGSNGSGDSQFSSIYSICTTIDNKIAVLDRNYSFVKTFETTGSFISKFSYSSSNWGTNYANYPTTLRQDAAGRFYLASSSSVWVCSSTGIFQSKFGSSGTGGSQFTDLTGLSLNGTRAYVSDNGNDRIVVFDTTTGVGIQTFGTYGTTVAGEMDGITLDASGNLFISDITHHRIRKFDPQLNVIKTFGAPGTGNGQFNAPAEMTIGPNLRLYVVDPGNHRVQIFDLDGNYIGQFGGQGAGNGRFNNPSGIGTTKDGRVYVADTGNYRVQIFDADGTYISSFGSKGSFYGQFDNPRGLAVCPDGTVAVADCYNDRIQYFDAAGNFIRKVGLWSSNHLMASSDGLSINWGSGLISALSQSGELLKSWYPPSGVTALAETPTGDLLSAGYAGGSYKLCLWKRTHRVELPEPGNAIPLPSILSQGRRSGTSLVDVTYAVKDADNTTVQTAALAFKNGGNTLNDVVPITSFAEGTSGQLGANISTGQTHRFTWDVAQDWSTDFGEVQLEILAKDSRGLLNLDFLQIPASGTLGTGTLTGTYNPVLKISRSPLNDNDFLSVWYWLIATGDPSIRFSNGIVSQAASSSTLSYDGKNGIPGLRASYYIGQTFTGAPAERLDSYVNIQPTKSSDSLDAPFRSEQLSVKWQGLLLPDVTGSHVIYFTADDGVRVTINNKLLINQWSLKSLTATTASESSASVSMTAGTPVPILVEYYDQGGYRAAQLSWKPPGKDKALIPPTNLSSGVTTVPGSVSYTPVGVELASGVRTTPAGRAFIFSKMGLREATAAEVTRAQEAGVPGVVKQWTPKSQVGPGERPVYINSYGFDTGGSGYWVVPAASN